jgi:hypothetical protein
MDRWENMKERPYKVWGLFNFGTLYEVGRTRHDCREHAERIIGKDFEKYFRDKSMRIAKVTVSEGWK